MLNIARTQKREVATVTVANICWGKIRMRIMKKVKIESSLKYE